MHDRRREIADFPQRRAGETEQARGCSRGTCKGRDLLRLDLRQMDLASRRDQETNVGRAISLGLKRRDLVEEGRNPAGDRLRDMENAHIAPVRPLATRRDISLLR